MKENFKTGAKLFLKLIVVNIMCFFVVMSFSVLSTAAFTKNVGYKAYGTSSDSSEPQELYTHYYADGEDTKKAEYEGRGFTVSESKIRSEMTRGGTAAFLAVSQIFCILILFSFIYPNIWHIGTTDSNLVKFKHKAEDKMKGLKIGLIAVAPEYLFLLFVIIAKAGAAPKFPVVLLKFLNAAFYSLTQVICGNVIYVSELSVIRLILLLLLPLVIPAVSCVSYILGYKNFSVGEKLIYKKK